MLKKISILLLVLFSACKINKPVGVYKSNYGWHTGNGLVLELNENGEGNIYGKRGKLVSGKWAIADDTLFLYAPEYRHRDSLEGAHPLQTLEQSFEHYIKAGMDSVSAHTSSLNYLYQLRPDYQLTGNDSIDILIVKKDRLYLFTKKTIGENYFYRYSSKYSDSIFR